MSAFPLGQQSRRRKKEIFMVSSLLKLILSLCAGALCLWQRDLGRSIASLFCFILCVVLMAAFLMDILRLILRKPQNKTASQNTAPVPDSQDSPNTPDLSDLKIGKTFRASDVEKFVENIIPLSEENPDYAFSESEIIDHYLADKKIWKYLFKPKNVTLQILTGGSVGILAEGRQIGCIRAKDCPRLLQAMKNKGVEVVYCTIGGGPYKIVSEDVVSGKYNMTEDETGYSVTLSIYEK